MLLNNAENIIYLFKTQIVFLWTITRVTLVFPRIQFSLNSSEHSHLLLENILLIYIFGVLYETHLCAYIYLIIFWIQKQNGIEDDQFILFQYILIFSLSYFPFMYLEHFYAMRTTATAQCFLLTKTNNNSFDFYIIH